MHTCKTTLNGSDWFSSPKAIVQRAFAFLFVYSPLRAFLFLSMKDAVEGAMRKGGRRRVLELPCHLTLVATMAYAAVIPQAAISGRTDNVHSTTQQRIWGINAVID